MCFSELDAAISAAGLPTRVRFCAAESAAQILQAAVPYGKVVLISEEGSDFALVSRLCESLREFRPVSVVLGKADGFAGLFSLADDIRAAVGVGARGALAARFFVTLRGGYSCAVPLSPCAGGIFEAEAPADTGWAGYPLKSADFVVADGERMRGRAAEVLAECSLAALCAEDIEIDAVFSRDRKTFDFRTPAEIALAAELTADGAKQLFCASALFQIALRGAPAFACTEAARALQKKTFRSLSACSLALFCYFTERYAELFRAGDPRDYYVPAYAERVKCCAAWAGCGEKQLFKNVRVPTAAESFRRAAVFAECRNKLQTSAQLLQSYAEKLRAKYYAAGGERPNFGKNILQEAYEHAAELTPLLCPPVLEREFGLLRCDECALPV